MFTQLRIKNFKAWRDEHRFDLAPVTLLLGVNSAGKTSVLQPLLLLKQTTESPDRRQHLNLGGQTTDVLHLGTYVDLINEHHQSRALAFGLTLRDSIATDGKAPSLGPSLDLEYDVSYTLATGGVPVVRCLQFAAGDRRFKAERQSKGGYLLDAPHSTGDVASDLEAGNAVVETQKTDSRRAYEPERSIALSAEGVVALGRVGAEIQDMSLRLSRSLKNIGYLGPLRENPHRSYHWNRQTPGDLGTKGEAAIPALLASANARGKAGSPSSRGWLVAHVSRWLKRTSVADSLTLEPSGKGVFEVIVTSGKTRANLVDVGFGVSQVLPVITLAYFVPEGSTIILEQPEIHLHPLAQSVLADLFVETARERHIQFLVETHSEHLLRRLQTRLAEERVQPSECSLYFIEQRRGAAEAVRLEVDDYGRIRNWPEKFFGDTLGEMEHQNRSILQRVQRTQGTAGP